MRGRLSVKSLREGLASVGHAAPKGGTDQGKDTFRGALLEFDDRIHLTGTSSSMTIEQTVDGHVIDPGRCIVPVECLKKLTGAMKSGDIELESTASQITIRYGKECYKCLVQDVKTFPEYHADTPHGFWMAGSEVSKAIRRSIGMCSDSVAYALGGCQLTRSGERLQVSACNGNDIAIQYLACQDDLLWIDRIKPVVPSKLLNTVHSLCTDDVMRIDVGTNAIRFTWGDTVVSGSLLQGRFPRVDAIAEMARSMTPPVSVVCQDMVDGLQRIAAIASPDTKGLTIRIGTDEIELSNRGTTADGRAVLDVLYSGPESTLSLNSNTIETILYSLGVTSKKGATIEIAHMNDRKGTVVMADGFIAVVAHMTM